jgi:hypothetical protein
MQQKHGAVNRVPIVGLSHLVQPEVTGATACSCSWAGTGQSDDGEAMTVWSCRQAGTGVSAGEKVAAACSYSQADKSELAVEDVAPACSGGPLDTGSEEPLNGAQTFLEEPQFGHPGPVPAHGRQLYCL